MWEFLTSALSAIPSAAVNKYALGADALAISAYVITVWRVARNKNLLENLQKLPAKDRLSALEVETGGVRLAAGISPEQWVRSRIHKYYLLAFFATCAVAVAITALAAWKGATYVGTLTIINNEYQRSNNGESLSSADLQHIKELIDAATTRDLEQARAAFNQLSEKARTAYQGAYPLAKGNLPSPGEMTSSESTTPPATKPTTRETEPNNSILRAKDIPLNATITAALGSNSDPHYYTFTMPGTKRDWVDVVLNNDSTTLTPTITVFRPDKSELSHQTNSTRGGDVTYSFVARPSDRHYIEVSPYYGGDYGNYRLTVRPRKAYDAYEPNDDILNASSIAVGKTIEAGIMDPADVDYYRFESGNLGKLIVSLENRSTTLAPTITVYNPDKSEQGHNTNSTRGGDVSLSLVTQPNSRYFVEVSSYYGDGQGNYALTVRPE
jgi:hypothetical protein